MKKIFSSLGVIGIVAVIAIGGTFAYFNDTETSTGNVFTAGSIDLTVDHLRQTYNGVDCQTCSVTIYSSPSETDLVAASVGAAYIGSFPVPATDVGSPHPNWVNETLYSPAQWIWATDPTDPIDTLNDVEYTFESTFNWQGPVVGVNLDLGLAADNGYAIYLNGTEIVNKLAVPVNFDSINNLDAAQEGAFSNAVVLGENTLQIVVRNHAQASGNPAGLLYFLEITSDCDLPEFQTHCTLFGEKDLEAGDHFFNFDDVKPGDYGTNVISLHVDSNDAYACLIVHDGDDQENLIVEPEEEYGDLPDVGNDLGYGELSNYLDIFAWEDVDGDGVYESGSEATLYGPGPILTQLIPLTLTGGGPTEYIGLAWCAGDISVNGDVITCDGHGMKDDAQSDSFTASVTAYAEQQRNNSGFDCADVDLSLQP